MSIYLKSGSSATELGQPTWRNATGADAMESAWLRTATGAELLWQGKAKSIQGYNCTIEASDSSGTSWTVTPNSSGYFCAVFDTSGIQEEVIGDASIFEYRTCTSVGSGFDNPYSYTNYEGLHQAMNTYYDSNWHNLYRLVEANIIYDNGVSSYREYATLYLTSYDDDTDDVELNSYIDTKDTDEILSSRLYINSWYESTEGGWINAGAYCSLFDYGNNSSSYSLPYGTSFPSTYVIYSGETYSYDGSTKLLITSANPRDIND